VKRRWRQAGAIAGLTVVMSALILGGCGKSTKTEKSDGSSDFSGKFIISAKEAEKKLNKEEVLFVDARGEDAARKGTIEGAVVTDWTNLSACQEGKAGDEGWGLVPEPSDLTVRLQALGIDKEKEIIVLGEPENGWGEDGRVLWELREAGCENVKIVDGGITAMKDIGVDVKADIKAPEKSDIEVTELDQSHDIMTEELQKNYGEYTIVDTRTPKEYDGAVLYDEAQGGRLPGAVNIPYTELFQSDGTLKDNDAITKMFEEKGIKKDDKVVTYCTGGIRSAYVQLVLEMCGYEYTYNYGQSFWRWAVVGEVEK